MLKTEAEHQERIDEMRAQGQRVLDYAPVGAPRYQANRCVCNSGAFSHSAQLITACCPWCDTVVMAQVCRLWPISCQECIHCTGRIEFTSTIENAR